MDNVGETKVKRPGSAMITVGVVIAVLGLLVAFMAIGSGGTLTVYVGGMILVGFILAVVGFCRRVLAALESR